MRNHTGAAISLLYAKGRENKKNGVYLFNVVELRASERGEWAASYRTLKEHQVVLQQWRYAFSVHKLAILVVARSGQPPMKEQGIESRKVIWTGNPQ